MGETSATPMKNLLLSLLVAVGLVGSASAAPPTNAPATVKPQWTFNYPNSLKSTYGWYVYRYSTDATGNTAIHLGIFQNQAHQSSPIVNYGVVWISSQGRLLGTINNINMTGDYYVVGVSGTSLITMDTDSDGNGNPYSYIRWTVGNGKLVRTPFFTGDQLLDHPPPPLQQGLIEVTETDENSNPTQFSFYHY